MEIRIMAPTALFPDQYDVWLEQGEHAFGLCIGSGKTKVDAITAAQRELQRLSRQLGEVVWQEYRRLEAPCFTNQNPTER